MAQLSGAAALTEAELRRSFEEAQRQADTVFAQYQLSQLLALGGDLALIAGSRHRRAGPRERRRRGRRLARGPGEGGLRLVASEPLPGEVPGPAIPAQLPVRGRRGGLGSRPGLARRLARRAPGPGRGRAGCPGGRVPRPAPGGRRAAAGRSGPPPGPRAPRAGDRLPGRPAARGAGGGAGAPRGDPRQHDRGDRRGGRAATRGAGQPRRGAAPRWAGAAGRGDLRDGAGLRGRRGAAVRRTMPVRGGAGRPGGAGRGGAAHDPRGRDGGPGRGLVLGHGRA